MLEPLSTAQAEAVFETLAATVWPGASADDRLQFVHHQTERVCPEYRFLGTLGFGGKFWRGNTTRIDGSYGEQWWVGCYPEDATEERLEAIKTANALLEAVRTLEDEIHG